MIHYRIIVLWKTNGPYYMIGLMMHNGVYHAKAKTYVCKWIQRLSFERCGLKCMS